MSSLGAIIKARRSLYGLSLREFSQLCNLSHTYIKNIEDMSESPHNKDHALTLESLEKISKALHLTLSDLLAQSGLVDSPPTSNVFQPSNLKLIRNGKSYEEISKEIQKEVNHNFDPMVYQDLESGEDKNPSPFLIEVLASYANVPISFFYKKNTKQDLDLARLSYRPGNVPPPPNMPSHIDDDLKKFIAKQDNSEYLELAKELYEKDINVSLVRSLIFK